MYYFAAPLHSSTLDAYFKFFLSTDVMGKMTVEMGAMRIQNQLARMFLVVAINSNVIRSNVSVKFHFVMEKKIA